VHQALDVLSHYAEATAEGDEEQDLMEDLTIINIVKEPLPWLQDYLYVSRDRPNHDWDAQAEAQWVATAWLAPWEHERQQRILRVLFWGDKEQRMALGPFKTGPLWWMIHLAGKPNKLTNVALERAGILKLALRWYQVDNGKPAERLDQLVPTYLPSLPVDPFDPEGKSFRYRLSRGEEIEWPPRPETPGWTPPPPRTVVVPLPDGSGRGMPTFAAPTRVIPAGQGILWSVGEDKIDDGGHRQTGRYEGLPIDMGAFYDKQDIIYLVPLSAKEK
jgi:hypothetical protein